LQVNPWPSYVFFDNATNGLLFSPENQIGDFVLAYDNRIIKVLNYTYGEEDDDIDGCDLPFRKYNNNFTENTTDYGQSPTGTINIGPNFNLPLFQAK
jgi:hypothetical protein